MNDDSITALIEDNPVGVDILPTLEEYVERQIQDPNLYHAECNRTILKFYTFQPTKINVDVVVKILIKAMMQLPSTDFMACLYIIPNSVQTDSTVSKLIRLCRMLQICDFQTFWSVSSEQADLFDSVPGFVEAIRAFIVDVIQSTFRSIYLHDLGPIINLSGNDLQEFLKRQSWSVDGDLVRIPFVEEQQPKTSHQVSTIIPFKQLGSLLKA